MSSELLAEERYDCTQMLWRHIVPCYLLSLQLCPVQGLQIITCMSMCMHPIDKFGQHANSAVSLMLTWFMVVVGIAWCLDCVGTVHSN